ncbi:hypothetical protein G5576_115909 [Homo sapiens]|uniref:Uncharacterized protein n=1 Tax=Homo sapiens TaxID=9606 RepID=A0A2R8YGN2_HUMAN|nr:hypothetical protein KI723_090883 [Homo sapiens]KAI2553681.1 hypothetical protein KI723_090883 [Homo sapiens]KAI4008210.1 hypothetical protein G5576_115909 [Homo sapiens]KAI4008211.1 hypothetical protein G5576_115909 [Homo sapiens]
MMSASRLAGTLIPAMAFLSCVRPESWEPCVEMPLLLLHLLILQKFVDLLQGERHC